MDNLPPVNNPIAEKTSLYPILDIVVKAIMTTLLIILIPKESKDSKSIKI